MRNNAQGTADEEAWPGAGTDRPPRTHAPWRRRNLHVETVEIEIECRFLAREVVFVHSLDVIIVVVEVHCCVFWDDHGGFHIVRSFGFFYERAISNANVKCRRCVSQTD